MEQKNQKSTERTWISPLDEVLMKLGYPMSIHEKPNPGEYVIMFPKKGSPIYNHFQKQNSNSSEKPTKDKINS